MAVHEIGHVLGLNHVPKNYSIMYAVYDQVGFQLPIFLYISQKSYGTVKYSRQPNDIFNTIIITILICDEY